MSQALKCPNPSCTYLFDPTGVPPGVVLTCPRCAMRFTLGPPAPPPAYPPPGYGAPPPQPPAPPPADLTFSNAPDPAGPPPKPGEAPPRAPARPIGPGGVSNSNTILLVVVSVALMLGVGLMVYFKLNPIRRGGGGGDGPGSELKDVNLALERPPEPWVRDEEMRVQLGPPFFLVYRRAEPDAYMAFAARDYDVRDPRPSELRQGLTGPLNTLFEDRTEHPIEGAAWLGRPAVAVEFRGQRKSDGTAAVGEAHAVGYKGIGYWTVCWTGEGHLGAVAKEFDDFRGRFQLQKHRDKWVAKEGEAKPFGGTRVPYQILDAEGVWAEPATAKAADFDPNADLYLTAREKRKSRDHSPEAHLLTLVLDPGAGDPLERAVEYVREQREAGLGGAKVTLTPRAAPIEGDPAVKVEPTAKVGRYEETVAGDRNQTRLRIVGALRVGGRLVAVSAWCSWEDRRVYEDRLVQIAGSLREGP